MTEPVALKDHEVRELMDQLVETARCYGGSEQLRERLAGVLLPRLKTSGMGPLEASPPPSDRLPYDLRPEQVAALLEMSGKPQEIAGNSVRQHYRIMEMLHWMGRFVRGAANPGRLQEHAAELAYYLATNANNRFVDVEKERSEGFKEGLRTTLKDRVMLERHGIGEPTEVTKFAQNWAWLRENITQFRFNDSSISARCTTAEALDEMVLQMRLDDKLPEHLRGFTPAD